MSAWRPASASRRARSVSPSCAACARKLVGDDLEHGESGRAGERIAAESPSETTGRNGVHDLRATRHAREREAAADRLARDEEVGLDAVVVLDRPHRPGTADPGLHLVVDVQDPVRAAELLQACRVVGRHRDEPALPLNRLEHDARDGRRVDVRLEQVLEGGDGVVGGDAAIGVRSGRAIYLGREGPEALCTASPCSSSSSRAASVRGTRSRRRRRRAAGRGACDLTAFSMASAPELTRSERCSPSPQGESSARRRQTSTYGS